MTSLIRRVNSQMVGEWSPQQISGFVAAHANGIRMSHQWICSFFWDDKARGCDLWLYLNQPKRRSQSRGQTKSLGLCKVPDRVGIEHRPGEVDVRLTIGRREGYTVLKGHKQSGLVTLVEHRSRDLQAARLPCITAELIAKSHDSATRASP